jgi:hypothetical protein
VHALAEAGDRSDGQATPTSRGRSATATTTPGGQAHPDIDVFVENFASVPVLAVQRIHLGLLAPQLKLEMQYALQCRHDERHGKIQPPVVNRVVDLPVRSGVTSLTDYPEPAGRQSGHPELTDTVAALRA